MSSQRDLESDSEALSKEAQVDSDVLKYTVEVLKIHSTFHGVVVKLVEQLTDKVNEQVSRIDRLEDENRRFKAEKVDDQ